MRMGHRTLSLALVLRALFLDTDAYEEMRDDDNPVVEGLFLVAVLAALTALLNLVGVLLAWATMPRMSAINDVVFSALQQQSWWPAIAENPAALASFRQWWDLGWRIFPGLFGAPDPAAAALNIVIWPFIAVLSWLIYGSLAYLFSRWLGGHGTFNQTLGTTALAWTPWLFYGLQVIPFLVIGGFVNTWQLILRYRAVRTAHLLPWSRAFWATLLPFAVYLLIWLLLTFMVGAVVAAIAGGR
jgi:hypothetical protein